MVHWAGVLDGGAVSSSVEEPDVRSVASTVTDSTSVASIESGHVYAALERGGAAANGLFESSGKSDAEALTTSSEFVLLLFRADAVCESFLLSSDEV